jgi:hypothetical protein
MLIEREGEQRLSDLVPEEAIKYGEVFRRGGRNLGDEDFALFKCPNCDRIYLLEYEVDTVYLDPNDLSRRAGVFDSSFECVARGREVPKDSPWIGPKASRSFGVTWKELEASEWSWVAHYHISDVSDPRGSSDSAPDAGPLDAPSNDPRSKASDGSLD